MFNSFEELCIMRVAVVYSFARVLNPRRGSVYIVIHRQTIFVVSQLFSVARYVGCLKLGWRLAQLYVRLCIIAISFSTEGFLKYKFSIIIHFFSCILFILLVSPTRRNRCKNLKLFKFFYLRASLL